MIYKIACVGRIKEAYFTELIDEYRRGIGQGDSLLICEVPDERIPVKSGIRINEMVVNAEAERLKSVIDRRSYIIVLCIEGKKTGTQNLRQQIEKAENMGFGCVTFVIGGSLGLSCDIIKMADYKMSISDMTFPHQLMRVVLTEQISRLYL